MRSLRLLGCASRPTVCSSSSIVSDRSRRGWRASTRTPSARSAGTAPPSGVGGMGAGAGIGTGRPIRQRRPHARWRGVPRRHRTGRSVPAGALAARGAHGPAHGTLRGVADVLLLLLQAAEPRLFEPSLAVILLLVETEVHRGLRLPMAVGLHSTTRGPLYLAGVVLRKLRIRVRRPTISGHCAVLRGPPLAPLHGLRIFAGTRPALAGWRRCPRSGASNFSAALDVRRPGPRLTRPPSHLMLEAPIGLQLR